MSAEARLLAAGEESCHLFGENNCGFGEVVPGAEIFFPEPWFSFGIPGTSGFTKYTVLLIICVLLVLAFSYFVLRRASVVPGRVQAAGELVIEFIRSNVVRQQIGKRGDKYMPLMMTLFLFIFAMNIMAIIPGLQLPVTSHLAYPIVLAVYIYVVWNYIGFREHGFRGHVIAKLAPPTVPKWVLPIFAPIEFFSTFLIRPFTHAVRLFATMLAGHLLLAVFAAAGWYMLNLNAGGVLTVVSVAYSALALVAFLVFTALELFIMALQAYVFVTLASNYIGESIEGGH
ncbi:F0F1 ATP synthase subunit A [Streptomonospora sp. PA3]|uniref:F0F1 ATP synthase subunit A n=1 Tax=Streptomonospora sp. PA3 TaxID=2607326 RepID=UPI0013074D3D|nr:F0F1 ATP synthase subunit A [Streptomonospora sp. PA3]